jgi:hypothetical protein
MREAHSATSASFFTVVSVAGILVTELVGKPKWFLAPAEEYWMPTAPLLAIQFLVLGFLFGERAIANILPLVIQFMQARAPAK